MNRTQDQVPPMPELTGRLRDAFQAAADIVQPDAVTPFSVRDAAQATRARSPERPDGAGPRRRWAGAPERPGDGRPERRQARRRALAPLAAAVAVVVIVAGSVLAFRALGGSHPHHPSPPRPAAPRHHHTATVPTLAGMPPFFVEQGPNVLGVHASTTGALLAEVSPPQPHEMFLAAAGTSVGRTFVIAVGSNGGGCQTHLYDLQLSATGQPVAYTPLSVPAIPEYVFTLAASPDGSTVAYAGEYCSGSGTGDVGVISLASRQIRRWTAPKQEDIVSLSLSGDGSLLIYVIEQTKLYPTQIGLLPTHSPTGTLAASSRVLVHQATLHVAGPIDSAAISPDGTVLAYSTYPASSPARTGVQLCLLGVHDSKRSTTISFHRASNLDIAMDPFGDYVLAQFTVGSSSRLDRVDLKTGKLTPLTATGLSPSAILTW